MVSADPPTIRSGADLVVQTLQQAGVTVIFSLSGNQIMPIYDACLSAGLRIVHVRHEAAAIYMAGGWADITGEIGVALLTAGPGFANGLAALYSVAMSESPVVLISGDTSRSQDGMGSFQEMAQTVMSGPLVKRAIRPETAERMGDDLAELIALARSGRWGPVHLAAPFDLLCQAVPGVVLPKPAALVGLDRALSEPDCAMLTQKLAQAERPLIVTGPMLSVARAGELVARLTAASGVPVITLDSPRGLGDPALGRAAPLFGQADVIVALGKAIDFSIGFLQPPGISEHTEVIVVAPSEEAARNQESAQRRAFCTVFADPYAAAHSLVRGCMAESVGSKDSEWRISVQTELAWRGELVRVPEQGAISSAQLCQAVTDMMAKLPEAILVCDGGEFGQWARGLCQGDQQISNGVAGAIGGGICQAIAIGLARPKATTIIMMGDGTAGFHLMEMDTAVRENSQIIVIIGNDLCWNAEHQIQLREYGPNRLIGCELAASARYDQVVAGLGGFSRYVESADALPTALREAVDSGLPACLNIRIEGLAAPNFR